MIFHAYSTSGPRFDDWTRVTLFSNRPQKDTIRNTKMTQIEISTNAYRAFFLTGKLVKEIKWEESDPEPMHGLIINVNEDGWITILMSDMTVRRECYDDLHDCYEPA